MDISDGWCASLFDPSPNVNLTFTEQLYLLYFTVRGNTPDYVTNFSLIYEIPSGERVTYMNVNGVSVRYSITCES